jgi:hypothetical protein
MSQQFHRTMRHLALAAATMSAGVLLGLATAPSGALAEDDDADKKWKCISRDDCGKGEKECCANGGSGGEVCSTSCPIIVQE